MGAWGGEIFPSPLTVFFSSFSSSFSRRRFSPFFRRRAYAAGRSHLRDRETGGRTSLAATSGKRDVLSSAWKRQKGCVDIWAMCIAGLKTSIRCVSPASPPFEIPEIQPEHLDIRHLEWIPFSDAKTAKNRNMKGVHFYIDDDRFARVWNYPDDYIQLLSEFGAVCSPDFSQYTDMPVAMRIYNHYRKHWLAAYWQAHGIHVIPTICWSDINSFAWCFDGEPANSVISISSVGTQRDEKYKQLFDVGCREAIRRLNPSEILWYGSCPKEFDWNIVKVDPYYSNIARRRKNGRKR